MGLLGHTIGLCWAACSLHTVAEPSDAPVGEAQVVEATRFEAIVLDVERAVEAKDLRSSLALRFPDAAISLWGPESADLKPPFVLVQLREIEASGGLRIRLLTDRGAVYTRTVSLRAARGEDRSDEVSRELTSLLLAVQEGLLDPDAQEDPPGVHLPVPPKEEPNADAPAPEPVSVASAIESEPSEPGPSKSPWRVFVAGTWGMSLPVPAFPTLGFGGGVLLGGAIELQQGPEIEFGLRWMSRARGSLALHRLSIFAGVGQRFAFEKLWGATYAVSGRVSFEPWWIRGRNGAPLPAPSPDQASAMVGLTVSQALLFPFFEDRGSGLVLGPVLGIGYSGMIKGRLSSLGVYTQAPETRQHAFTRIGGLEATVGLRLGLRPARRKKLVRTTTANSSETK